MNEKTLGQDGWFWGFIGLGAVFSLISLGFIIYSDNLIWCGSSRCFSDALEIFRFPVQTFTAGIALATLRALMFRSEQTAKQIEISNMQIAETTKQNLVKNFFEHRKDFSELLMGIEKDYGLKFRKRNGLYFSIFPENGFYYFSPDSTGSRFKVPQLIKWVTDFNIIIERLNNTPNILNLDPYLRPVFLKWLRDLSRLVSEMQLDLLEGQIIHIPLYEDGGYFSDDFQQFNLFPIDLHEFLMHVSDMLSILIEYCFPNIENKIRVLSVNEFVVSPESLNGTLWRLCEYDPEES